MKKLFIITILFTTGLHAQGSFTDSPFALGIGYTPAWYVPSMDVVNSEFKNFGAGELSNSGFYVSGFGGFIYLPFIAPHFRVGGIGFGGSTSQTTSLNGVNKELVYNISGGGITLEYSLPVIRDIGISLGATIGAGSLELESYKNGGSFDWNAAVGELNTFSPDINRKFRNSYWFVSPTLNIDIPVLSKFVVFRIGGGYQVTFGGEWTADNDKTLQNAPSGLDGNSFFIQTGLFIGFFSF